MHFIAAIRFTSALVIASLLYAAAAWSQGMRADVVDQQTVDAGVPELVRAGPAKSPTGNAALAVAMQAREVARSRTVTLDLSVLQKMRGSSSAKQQQTVRIAFFEDAALRVEISRTERFGKTGTAYLGKVAGEALSSVVIVEENGVVSGNINVGASKYEIRNVGEAGHVMRQINIAALPPDHSAPMPAVGSRAVPMRSSDIAPTEGAVNTAADDGSLIDVMVVYTPAARISQGGAAAMNSLINLGVAETNNAYANSVVKQRVRLVYEGEVN